MGKSRKGKLSRRQQRGSSDAIKSYVGSAQVGSKLQAKYFGSAAVVALITFLVYLPALRNGFVEWDDPAYISDNVHIRSIDKIFFKWAFFDFYASNWHPLTWLSHAIDYAIWGLNPTGHHLTGILFHSINTFLVVLLGIQLLNAYRSHKIEAGHQGVSISERTILTAGIITGLLFGLHPLHVESVAWVSERKDMLSAFFFLLSLLAYIRYTVSVSGASGFWSSKNKYAASLVFFIFALMSKPMAVVLPIVFLIIDWYPLGRFKNDRLKTILFEKIPFFVLAVASSVITIMAQHSGEAIKTLTDYPLSTRILVGFNALFSYIGKMLWPVDLSPFYPYPDDVSFLSYEYLLPLLSAIGITITSIALLKRHRIWFVVWMYYVVTLLPVLGIVQVGLQAMADRYTYLPGISLFFLAGVGSAGFIEKFSKQRLLKAGTFIGISALIIYMAYAAVIQIYTWKDTLSLWTRVADVVSKKDDKYYKNIHLIYFNLGSAYMDRNRLEDAMKATQKAISLNPVFDKSHYNLGIIYASQNRLEDAIDAYKAAIRLNPAFAGAHVNLGIAYRRHNQPDEAMVEFKEAVRLKPDYAEARVNLGVAYINENKLDDAIRELHSALRLKPDYVMAYINLGVAYRKQNKFEDAIKEFQASLRLRPDFAESHYELGVIFKSQGRLEEAIREFQTALRLKPDFVKARDNLNLVLGLMRGTKK